MPVIPEIQDYILTMIERELAPGRKLPGARRIAERFSCSLPKVQAVLDLLEQSGVVESRQRSGTYVRTSYKERLLMENISCSTCIYDALGGVENYLRKEYPELHLSDVFTSGGVEIVPALSAVRRRECYQDITGAFRNAFPEREQLFYMRCAAPFTYDERIFAIPLTFSPQLLWYNPDIFNAASVAVPGDDWGEADFFAAMRSLNRTVAGKNIINYSVAFESWLGFILSSGAALYDSCKRDPVTADSLPTIGACLRYISLLREFDLVDNPSEEPERLFAGGKLAMYVGALHSGKAFQKHTMKFTPGYVCMPDLGGRERFFDLFVLAFRRDFKEQQTMLRLLKFFLSEPVQIVLGKSGCGVPFLRSAAEKVFDFDSGKDKLLLEKMPQFCSNFNIPTDLSGEIISRSAGVINTGHPGELRQKLYELATAMRFLRKLRL